MKDSAAAGVVARDEAIGGGEERMRFWIFILGPCHCPLQIVIICLELIDRVKFECEITDICTRPFQILSVNKARLLL